MAATKYTYSVSTDFTSGVDSDGICADIAASSIVTACSHINIDGDNCDVWFADALSAGDQTTLDSVVAAHDGTPPTRAMFHASSVLTDHEEAVTDTDPSWTELGGAVTTPSFFSQNLAGCRGRVVGRVKTNGTGAKLRICEDGVESGSYDVPDTSGAWAQMQWFSTSAPNEGLHTYTLEGQLPSSGATELKVKYVAVSLLEFY